MAYVGNKQTKKKKKKHTALIVCRNSSQFWTTQAQFWQWARECIIVKTQDHPLTGMFVREDEEILVVLNNTILNLACPNHLRETLLSHRLKK